MKIKLQNIFFSCKVRREAYKNMANKPLQLNAKQHRQENIVQQKHNSNVVLCNYRFTLLNIS